MAEPENQALRLLREFREEARGFREEMSDFRADMREFQLQTDRTLNKIVVEIAGVTDKLENLTRAVAGEIVQSRYSSAGVDDRISDLERRLAALEQPR